MTEKQLIMYYILFCLLSMIAIYFIHWALTKLRNNKKKTIGKKSTHKYAKVYLSKCLTENMKQDFIGQRKMIFNELVRM